MESLSDLVKIPEDILEKAGTLDRYYIPTRYPNGFERGAPRDYFFQKDAEDAIQYAEEIIKFSKKWIST